jgi:hypothetical protein
MGIVFFCQSCGSRFEVDPRMAGRKGRCKKCGQFMEIPQAEQIASMAAMPALAAAAVGGGGVPGPAAASPSIGGWLKTGAISQVALAPLTLDRVPIRKRKPDPLDDAEDSKPYVLARPLIEDRGRAKVQDNVVLRLWRQQLGGLMKIFRKINQAAYLLSVPFIMILLLGTAVRSRPMAMLGAAAVVVLNIGRLAAGVVNLALVPFRDGLDWKKMKNPLRRVAEPALTVGLVGLAFLFIPWLSTGEPAKRGIAGFIGSLEKRTQDEMDKAKALIEPKKLP